MAMAQPNFHYERALYKQGLVHIAGVDEVGCGAWAGPVYAAAVILIPGKTLSHVRDSKQVSAIQRKILSQKIKTTCLSWSIGIASVEEIETLNIRQASLLASQRAIQNLSVTAEWILSDAFNIPGSIPCTPIIHGDAISKSIAAASIIAKVARDEYMLEIDKTIPGYAFAKHKGYGTKLHQEALKKLGPSKVHRAGYEPIKKLLPSQVLKSP